MKKIILSLSLLGAVCFSEMQAQSWPEKQKQNPGSRPVTSWPVIRSVPVATPQLAPYKTLPGSPENYLALPVPPQTEVVRDAETGEVVFVKQSGRFVSRATTGLEQAQVLATTFIREMKTLYGIVNPEQELVVKTSELDDLGHYHIRFGQVANGVPIHGTEAVVHLDGSGDARITGRLKPSPVVNAAAPSLAAEGAADVALAHLSAHTTVVTLNADQKRWLGYEAPESELLYYPTPDAATPYSLAWYLTVRPNFMERHVVVVDAHSGEILKEFDHTCAVGPVTASGQDLNGVSRTVNTFQAPTNQYYLIDATKPMYTGNNTTLPDLGKGIILTADMNNTTTQNPQFTYIVSNNNAWNAKSISAHYNAGVAHDYFRNAHNHNSINNNGGDIISFINVADDDGQGLDNAYWNGSAMFYGNGRQAFFPLAGSLDVAGHEMAHGVIQATGNMEYQDEPGALNESFADIFGVMIDRDDWLLGDDVVKVQAFPSGALRSMSDPHNGGSSLNDNGYQPRIYAERYTGTQDNGGVHINSGIPNWAFFKFATATSKDIAEDVYYRALKQYLTRSSKFIDCRIAVEQAATDLHGANSAVVQAARTAFDQVGILGNTTGGGTGGQNYQPQIPPNPGAEFIVSTDTNPSDPNEFYISSTSGTNFQALSTTTPKKRISVTDNGQFGYFVGTDGHIRRIRMNAASPQETILSNQPEWDNVAISKDGTLLAAVSSSVDTSIYVFNLAANPITGVQFILYNPSTAQGVSTGGVLYADAIEFDHSGEYVLYDAFNRIPTALGNPLEYWDMGFLRVWNKSANNWGDGTVQKVFSNLSAGISVGNAVFSKNSPAVVAFDYIDNNTNEQILLTANLENGNVGEVFNNLVLSFPNYSNLDDKLLFNAESTGGDELIAVIPLAQDKLTPAGAATGLISDGKFGVWYATGNRVINVKLEDELLLLGQVSLFPNPASDLAQLQVTLSEPSRVEVILTNAMGQPVWKQSETAMPSGQNQITVPVEGLSTGMYLLQIRADNEWVTRRLVKR
jgi:Zn-dependent metalloprotease